MCLEAGLDPAELAKMLLKTESGGAFQAGCQLDLYRVQLGSGRVRGLLSAVRSPREPGDSAPTHRSPLQSERDVP